MQMPSAENLRFGGVPLPTLAVITTPLCGQPQDPILPGERGGEDQNREARARQDSNTSMTLPRVVPRDMHRSVMNE